MTSTGHRGEASASTHRLFLGELLSSSAASASPVSLILSGCFHSVNFLFSDFFSCVLQSVTFSTCLQDVAAMRQSIQYGTSQSCVSQYLRPLLEGQVRRYNDARSFIRLRNDIEEQFASRLACRDISQLVKYQHIQRCQALFHSQELLLLYRFQHLCN